jgi:hypothetical protein
MRCSKDAEFPHPVAGKIGEEEKTALHISETALVQENRFSSKTEN